MVCICGENVHSSQYLLAHPCFRHDAPGPGLRHCPTQHVWPEEHLCPGYVRNQEDKGCFASKKGYFKTKFVYTLSFFQYSETSTSASCILRGVPLYLQCRSARWRRVHPSSKTQVGSCYQKYSTFKKTKKNANKLLLKVRKLNDDEHFKTTLISKKQTLQLYGK